VRYIQVHVILE